MFEDENEDEFLDDGFQEEISRFEKSLKGEPLGFMDSDTIESIIDHYLIQGNYSKASLIADVGIQQFPYKSVYFLRKAQAVSGLGQLKEALSILSKIDSFLADSCEFYLTKASIFSQLRDSKNAIKYFSDALAVAEPEDKDEIFIDLAMEYENQADFKGAVKILQEALQYNPKSEVAIYELAFCYDQLREFEKAISCYKEYIDENPYSYTSWYNLGNTYAKQNKHEQAIWAYDYCIVINEDFAPAYFNLGSSYLSLEKYQTAIDYFSKCIEFDDEDAMCFCYLGECYEQLGNLELAKKHYYKSLEINPELGDALLGVGIVKDLEGDTHGAISWFLKSLDIEPANPGYLHVIAGAYDKLGDKENAEKFYLTAYQYDEENTELIQDYIDFLIKIGLNSQALDFIQSIDSKNNDIVHFVLLQKANLCFLNNDEISGIEFLSEAIIIDEDKARQIFSLNPDLINNFKIVNLFSTSNQ
jgi:tetratricopeptide (TPR) repeat protein